jgi:hypothetical protein
MPKLILRIVSDSNTSLNIKLEKELLRGISDAAMASGKYIQIFAVRKIYINNFQMRALSRVATRKITFHN